ncbi:ThiF family adenylyltransferase [Pseudonocardia sp. Cha107L01]|uniref:ThiF family adenylyltransferase n=1 Tax=Pseudonocardia sp. Cha107L01 TaxID=3457576 RepID=UPI00403EF3E0
MSRRPLSRSADLLRLREEGYDLDIQAGHLLVRVPYATAERTVAYGTLVSSLALAGDQTMAPDTHVVFFIGERPDEQPCDAQGQRLVELIHQDGPIELSSGLVAGCGFSHKPDPTYPDYYAKMATYADMLLGYAQVLDPDATTRTFPPVPAEEDESVFRYIDSATSRARIGMVTEKLAGHRVAIIGLGGTGSYILDLLAKTPVCEIRLYDRDQLLTHNAFRSPGAPTLEQLRAAPRKVEHFQTIYDAMHRRVIAHPVHVDESNIDQLRELDFVFVAIDAGPAKKLILRALQSFGVPFIDTGMGIYQAGQSLGGIVRTTASLPGNTEHIWDNDRISFADEADADYDQNIQIADLNMLNAVMAVIRWKKSLGFYLNFEHELSSAYTIDGNHLLNHDQTAEDHVQEDPAA